MNTKNEAVQYRSKQEVIDLIERKQKILPSTGWSDFISTAVSWSLAIIVAIVDFADSNEGWLFPVTPNAYQKVAF